MPYSLSTVKLFAFLRSESGLNRTSTLELNSASKKIKKTFYHRETLSCLGGLAAFHLCLIFSFVVTLISCWCRLKIANKSREIAVTKVKQQTIKFIICNRSKLKFFKSQSVCLPKQNIESRKPNRV